MQHDNVDLNGTFIGSDEGFLKVKAELVDTPVRDRCFIGGVGCKESNRVYEQCTHKRVENHTIFTEQTIAIHQGEIGSKTICCSLKCCQLGHRQNSDQIHEAVNP